MSHDTFADIEAIEPGAFVTVRVGETAYMAGVVDNVDPETRTLHFTDGRSYTPPPDTAPVAESEPGKENAE